MLYTKGTYFENCSLLMRIWKLIKKIQTFQYHYKMSVICDWSTLRMPCMWPCSKSTFNEIISMIYVIRQSRWNFDGRLLHSLSTSCQSWVISQFKVRFYVHWLNFFSCSTAKNNQRWESWVIGCQCTLSFPNFF